MVCIKTGLPGQSKKEKEMKQAREVLYSLTFSKEGTFQSYYEATGWCRENGYSYGSTCRNEPIALMKGDFNIAKWKNLTAKERYNSDGIMTGDFREGDVHVTIFKPLVKRKRMNKKPVRGIPLDGSEGEERY